MRIVQIEKNHEKKWDEFIKWSPYGSFLQSWEWGDFQESLAKKIWRIAVEENNEFIACGLFLKYRLPPGLNYLYSPHGPVISEISDVDPRNIFRLLAEEIKKIAKQENSIFWRMDPAMPDSKEEREEFEKLGLIKSFKEIQTKETLILDIAKSEEEILADMKPKTRYNIKLARKKSVKVFCSKENQYFENFWRLAQETTKRDKFRSHPKEYYQKMLELPFAELFLAEYQDKIIAANIAIFFGKRAIYLHGFSSDEYRNAMAPYLLQWEAIKEAKKRGVIEYDFWGIGKKWPGFTRFKKGFGGEEINYMGAYDVVYKLFWHKLYNLYHRT